MTFSKANSFCFILILNKLKYNLNKFFQYGSHVIQQGSVKGPFTPTSFGPDFWTFQFD